MSAGNRMPLERAEVLAARTVEALEPYVTQIVVVGSIRRRRPTVGDIEILVRPRQGWSLLEAGAEPDVELVRAVLLEIGEWVKGGNRMMQVTNLLGEQDVTLDVYLCHPPAQWGSLLAIRTGPAKLGELCVKRMRAWGLRHLEGHVRGLDGQLVPTPTEREFFEAARVPYEPPERRDALGEKLRGKSGEWSRERTKMRDGW